MYSVLHFLHSLIPSHFNCNDHHQHHFSIPLWLPCRPNQSGNIWRGTHIVLLWEFQILDAIVLLYIRFNVCYAIVFTVIWIDQVLIQVKSIFCGWKAFRCAILITFDRMTVDSSDAAGIQYSSLSSREVLCRQTWWQRRSFWQCKCSHTIMLKEWQACFDGLFCVRNGSYGIHLLLLSMWFLLG